MPELCREGRRHETSNIHRRTTVHWEMDSHLSNTDVDNGPTEHCASKIHTTNEGVVKVGGIGEDIVVDIVRQVNAVRLAKILLFAPKRMGL